MEKKSQTYSRMFRDNFMVLVMRTAIFSSTAVMFGLSPNNSNNSITTSTQQQQKIVKGVITDANGLPVPGVTVLEKGTTNGTMSDFDGNYSITPKTSNPVLIFTYIGYTTKELAVNNQSSLNVTLEENVSELDEVVVVGYGTQKKLNLTAAVSQVDEETFKDRPVSNASRALQGASPGLVVSNAESGGQPGAAPNINLRGFQVTDADGNLSDASPLILVDGIEMDLNNVDPADIASVSVLKDAASASIYGSRAAAGAVIITTKSGKDMKGKVRVNYSNNFSISQPTIWPESVDALTYAYVMNDARANLNASPYWDEDALERIRMNMENPGSAATLLDENNDGNWDQSSAGLGATGATDWKDFLFKDWAHRSKHNLSIAGGDEKLNYYLSTGIYNEGGLLAVGDEDFRRLNLDAKISNKATDWLTLELYTKVIKSETDYPTDIGRGTTSRNTARIFDLLSKIKPTLPTVDPFGGELVQAYYPLWKNQRYQTENNQLVVSPRAIIEPIKDLKLNLQLNYRRNNNEQAYKIKTTTYLDAFGNQQYARTQNATNYAPTLINNEYVSPNLFATYNKSIGKHNFDGTVGFQSENYQYHSLGASVDYLITDNVISTEASLDDTPTVSETIDEWATMSGFARLRYNYDEKYLFEATYRKDGSSRYEEGSRWLESPSFSLGYNIAKEEFWPLEDVSTFKIRGSQGILGSQNVSAYQYLSTIDINTPGTAFLFDGNREIYSSTPSLISQNLTWEKIRTTDIGIDINAFNNKLGIIFDWYRSDTEGIQGPGADLPAVLGTSAPNTNIGTMRVEGWELEANWKQTFGDFSYNIKGVLSDYKRTIVEYPNDANSLAQSFAGQDLGDIWGFQWDGWFMTDDEYQTYDVDQSFVAGNFWAGDTKYKDLDGNGVIDRGSFTKGDSGDYQVIGNTTPRYQYSVTLGMQYKNWDFNAFIQGIGKRDVRMQNQGVFKGPAQGPFHAMVYDEHLDYFRAEDTTSPLGANTDAYFPAPYSANPGQNNRNYKYNVDRYIQNGAYTRLKSLQIGYTIPKEFTKKYKINNFRIFITGENLLTFTDLMILDPESISAGFGNAQSYPLSKIISTGVNISF